MNERVRRALFTGLVLLAIAGLGAFLWNLGVYGAESRQLDADAATTSRAEARRGREDIERKLRRVMALADTLAADLRTGAVSRETLPERVRRTVHADPDVAEMGVAFSPFAFEPGLRLHGVAFAARGRAVEPVELDAARDYTDPETAWYHRPLEEGPIWLEPTMTPGTHALVAVYALPFQEPNGSLPRGVVYVAYAVEHLAAELDTLDLGTTGYAYVLSARGGFLAHPNRANLDGRTTILDVARDDPALAALAGRMLAGEAVAGPAADTVMLRRAWVTSEPIAAARWSLVVVVDRRAARRPAQVRGELTRLGLTLAFTWVLLAAVAARVDRRGPGALWVLSGAYSAAGLGAVAWILFLVYRLPDQAQYETPIPSKSALARFVAAESRKDLTHGGTLPLPLPTGIMLQSIVFVSTKEVRLTGYVWQRYQDGMHDGVVQGFAIPESDSFDAVEAYRERSGDTEVVGWSFKAVLRQDFSHVRFPFGEETLRIPLWPRDFRRNVLLVPDLDAYTLVSPRARPGLRESLSVPSWDIQETLFSYAPRAYNTRFGFGAEAAPASLPQLQLNVVGRKQITGPLVTYFLPVAVVMMMLFGVVLLGRPDFDASKVIGTCGGFFLAVVFAQIDLRKTLDTRDLVYLEYFHLLADAAILTAALHAVVFLREKSPLTAEHAIYPKLLYWPGLLTIVLAFTLLTFH